MKFFSVKNKLLYFIVITFILVFLLLFYKTQGNHKQFEQYHQLISEHSRQSVSSEIQQLFSNLRTELNIIATENPTIIAELANDPDNEQLLDNFKLKLSQYFPNFYAVTITNHLAELLIDDFGEDVGDLCRSDLSLFIKQESDYATYVHPHNNNYHIDIMVPWHINDDRFPINEGIFFVSFNLYSLINLIKTTQVPGHKIYLLNQNNKNLIELTDKGSRDKLDGQNFLSQSLSSQIIYRKKIEGTLWEVVDLLSSEMVDKHHQKLYKENILIILGLSIFIFSMLFLLIKEERKRKSAEIKLFDTNKNLEQLVVQKTIDLQKFYYAIEQSSDATIITNKKGVIEYVNKAFLKTSGYTKGEIIGQTNQLLKSGQHDKNFYDNMWLTLLSGKSFHSIFINKNKSGNIYHEDKIITPIKDAKQKILFYVGTGRDISDKIKYEEELNYLAHHDSLTGLANRVLLHDRIDHSIVLAHRKQHKLALMFLDLDRFKSVNDHLGHVIGDKVLIQVAKRLTDILREGDTICRNGGDEFIILMETVYHDEDIASLAQKIIKAINTPFIIQEHTVSIGISIGIAIYPDNGTTHIELIKHADTAMYRAKQDSTVSYEFYNHHMSLEVMERVSIEMQLQQALGNNEFYLVYQPKVNLDNEKTIGFEALLRWENPKLGFVSPFKFITILEKTGLIHEIGEWVISQVINNVSQGVFQDKLVSINLSPVQFRDPELINKIKEQLYKRDILASQIEFEVTESLMLDDFTQSKEKLYQLSQLGCSIALDDFGTGYSSLSYLTQLPINVLKVDRSFIINIHQHVQQQAILESIMFMTKKLNIETIIEGVEIEEELNVIKKLGGQLIQGYYFSKPLKIEEIATWLGEGS